MMNSGEDRESWRPARAEASAWLSAIVDHSQDAILSKTLDGIITSWNASAERLFGYTREEAVGQPITMLIPDDRLHEEVDIIARLRAGESIERMETVRCAKDGSPVHVEVSISPVRDASGTIIGASKIVHDIGERLRFAEDQALIVREMQHRIKNLLSVVQALVGLGRRSASDVDSFADELTKSIAALASAQSLVLNEARSRVVTTTLGEVLETLLSPYGTERISLPECDVPVGEKSVTSLALLFHELATNAAKYGALSAIDGHLQVDVLNEGEAITLQWIEHGGTPPDENRNGFGSNLITAALRGFGASIDRSWTEDGYRITLRFEREALAR